MLARSVVRPPPWAWPLVFESGDANIAAFFHPADESRARDAAVVLCNPIGWEAVAAHRAQRHLAEKLAAHGFPVLRFDYPGTGDSSGADADPGRLESWLSGLGAAVEHMRRLTQREKVVLVGFHFGATLAVLAARRAGGLETLVLWSPYAKGRAYLREARAYRALNAATPGFPSAEDGGGLEAAGFLLSAGTLADIDAIDLSVDPVSTARQVLILERSEKPTPRGLTAALEAGGAVVETVAAPGFLDMMQEPRKSVVPETTIARIVEYLDRSHEVVASAPSNPEPMKAAKHELSASATASVVEEALTFGSKGEFFGVLSEPSVRASSGADRPAILLLTTASHHRVGPNRMYVPMARELARLGFTSLRFDLTGVGDTPTVPGIVEGHAYAASFVNDVVTAMNHLQTSGGFNRFVTVGLCSGAYLGFHASLADERVSGAVLINPQTFNWREGDSLEINRRVTFQSTRHYQRAARDPKTWLRAVRGDVDLRGIGKAMLERWKKRAEVEAWRALRRFGHRDPSGRVDVGDAFHTLVERGADILMIYSGNDEGLDYLNSEVGSRLGRLRTRPTFRLEVIDGPDHTFTQLWAQERLSKVILDHTQTRFGGAGGRARDRVRIPIGSPRGATTGSGESPVNITLFTLVFGSAPLAPSPLRYFASPSV